MGEGGGAHGLQRKRRGIIRILQSLKGRLGKFYYDTTKILQPSPPPPLPRDKQCLTVISQITDVSLDYILSYYDYYFVPYVKIKFLFRLSFLGKVCYNQRSA